MVVALADPLELVGQGVTSSWRGQKNNDVFVISTPDPGKGGGVWAFGIGVFARSQTDPKAERN